MYTSDHTDRFGVAELRAALLHSGTAATREVPFGGVQILELIAQDGTVVGVVIPASRTFHRVTIEDMCRFLNVPVWQVMNALIPH